jgi:hypothetical protein
MPELLRQQSLRHDGPVEACVPPLLTRLIESSHAEPALSRSRSTAS